MLSGEGNVNGEKQQPGVISKNATLHVHAAHFFCTFLCRCIARLQRETSRNFLVTRFMEEIETLGAFRHTGPACQRPLRL